MYAPVRGSVLQCVAVCCSALQCVAMCCSVLQCVAMCYSVLQCVAVDNVCAVHHSLDMLISVVFAVCQYVAVRCSALQWIMYVRCTTH